MYLANRAFPCYEPLRDLFRARWSVDDYILDAIDNVRPNLSFVCFVEPAPGEEDGERPLLLVVGTDVQGVDSLIRQACDRAGFLIDFLALGALSFLRRAMDGEPRLAAILARGRRFLVGNEDRLAALADLPKTPKP